MTISRFLKEKSDKYVKKYLSMLFNSLKTLELKFILLIR